MSFKKALGFGCLFLFACLASIPAAAEETSYAVIEYNFLTGEIDASSLAGFRIPHGQGVRLRVKNFNSFLYDIAVNQQTISYNQTIPTLISAALAGSAPALAPDRKTPEVRPDFDNLERNFQKALSDAYNKLPEAERIVIGVLEKSDGYEQAELVGRIKADLKDYYSQDIISPADLRKELTPLTNLVIAAWQNLDDFYKKLGSPEQEKIKNRYDSENARFLVFQGKDKAILESALDNAVGTWRAIETAKFETYTPPFFADGDELILKLTATRKTGLGAGYITSRVCSDMPIVKLLTKGGVKVDFSTGFVFASRPDRAYYLLKNEAGENIITRDKKSEALCTGGAGAFIHIHGRQKRPLKLAGTFGVMVSKTNALDYFAGPSILFGKSERGVFTAGIGVRTISKLSGEYREGDPLPEDVTVIPLINVPKFSAFFGFSFNFGGL